MEDEQLVPFLKKRGLRITAQRVLILKTIASLGGHPSAEDIHRELPYMSLPTIYSNLKLFVKLGILKELSHGDAKANMNYLHQSTIMLSVNHAEKSLIWTILTSKRLSMQQHN